MAEYIIIKGFRNKGGYSGKKYRGAFLEGSYPELVELGYARELGVLEPEQAPAPAPSTEPGPAPAPEPVEEEVAEDAPPENPIPEYDGLNAKKANKAIRQLSTREQLEAVLYHEKLRSQPRVTVIREIKSELDELGDE